MKSLQSPVKTEIIPSTSLFSTRDLRLLVPPGLLDSRLNVGHFISTQSHWRLLLSPIPSGESLFLYVQFFIDKKMNFVPNRAWRRLELQPWIQYKESVNTIILFVCWKKRNINKKCYLRMKRNFRISSVLINVSSQQVKTSTLKGCPLPKNYNFPTDTRLRNKFVAIFPITSHRDGFMVHMITFYVQPGVANSINQKRKKFHGIS